MVAVAIMAVVTAVVGATMGEAAVVDGAMEAATAAVVAAAAEVPRFRTCISIQWTLGTEFLSFLDGFENSVFTRFRWF